MKSIDQANECYANAYCLLLIAQSLSYLSVHFEFTKH